MRVFKALVILTLLAAIGGMGFGAYYFILLKPKEIDKQDWAANGPNAQATPDPSTPDFEQAKALCSQRRYAEARTALESFLSNYPDSSHHREAEELLGNINVGELFSGSPGPNKTEYIVQRGDVLDRVATKTKSSAELIFRANNLSRIILQIGQRLIIPQVNFAIEAHLGPEKKLLLLNRGQFFKSYPIQDHRPLAKKTPEIRTKVFERLAFKDSKRVTFGNKDYPGSVRSLSLVGQPNYTIYGKSGDASDKPDGSGIALSASDIEELHTLVSPGTPVILNSN
jgi:LysM repeat protein